MDGFTDTVVQSGGGSVGKGQRQEPKEMYPFSLMMTSLSCTKIHMWCHDLPAVISWSWVDVGAEFRSGG